MGSENGPLDKRIQQSKCWFVTSRTWWQPATKKWRVWNPVLKHTGKPEAWTLVIERALSSSSNEDLILVGELHPPLLNMSSKPIIPNTGYLNTMADHKGPPWLCAFWSPPCYFVEGKETPVWEIWRMALIRRDTRGLFLRQKGKTVLYLERDTSLFSHAFSANYISIPWGQVVSLTCISVVLGQYHKRCTRSPCKKWCFPYTPLENFLNLNRN